MLESACSVSMSFELFLPIQGYDGMYSVSNYGNVKSYWKDKKDGKLLKPLETREGYLQVVLYKDGKRKKHYIHRLVLENFDPTLNMKDMQVDHIDRNRLNNNVNNLRWATKSQNSMNASMKSSNTSGVVGVHWHKQRNKWVAYIYINGKRTHIGYFNTLEEATRVRQVAEEKYYGQYRPIH